MLNLTIKSKIKHNHYQTHIDGIRAIAVLAVIAFHASSQWLPGGFIGVDIFFVISGYLISSIIYKQFLEGAFSLGEFYVRRIRRIFPLLIVIIVATFPIAWLILLPDEMRSYSKSIFSSLFMYSNQQFLSEAGYFDTESHLKPLLHTWSLAIEAQFYLIFPLVFVWVLKLKKRAIYLIAALAFISFFAADMATSINSEKSFFYFFARAWEMLAGCLLMIMVNNTNQISRMLAEVLSITGLSLVLYAFLYFDKMMLHPGRLTLIPVIGCMLLIAYGHKHTLIGKLLTLPVMVYVGLISYGLYLWHQPAIVFVKLATDSLSVTDWVMLFVLITILSILTWRYVETPFRSKKVIKTPNLLFSLGSLTMVLVVIGLLGHQSNGFMHQRFSADKAALLHDLDSDRYGDFLFKNLYANEIIKSKFKKNSKPRILIVGDSFAADFINMVAYNNYLSDFQIRTLYISTRCQFYMGDKKYRELIDRRDEMLCEQAQMKLQFLKQNLNKVDHIIFAFDWKPWVAKHISQSISALNYQGRHKLIFIGSKRFRVNKRELLAYAPRQLATVTSERSDRIARVNQILREQIKSNIFIDQDAVFCGQKNQCILFTADHHPVSSDGSHLTPEGAAFLGELLFKCRDLAQLNSQN